MSVFHRICLGGAMGSFDLLFKEASRLSNLTEMLVDFDFNGVKVNIAPKSTLAYTWIKTQEAIKLEGICSFGEGTS